MKHSTVIPLDNYNISFKTAKFALLFLFLGVSGIIDDKGNNPIGIPYVAEMFQAILLFYSVLFFLRILYKDGIFYRIDTLLFFLVIGSWFLSAVNASLVYDQPLFYGLIEDRRILNTLIYFPVVYTIRRGWINQEDIIHLIITVAVIAIVLSIAFLSMGFVDDTDGITSLRKKEGRVSIGTHFIVLSTLLAFIFSTYSENKKIIWVLVLAICMAMLFLVTQNRKIVITLITVMFLYSFARRRVSIFILFSIVIVTITLITTWPLLQETHIIQKLLVMWGGLLDEKYLTQSARAQTIIDIWKGLHETHYLGHGALSLVWNDGFHRYYGDHFFLADIGYVGFAFRYGILQTIVFLGLGLYLAYSAYQDMTQCPLKNFVGIALLFIILAPGAGLFLYAGKSYGILLAIASGFSIYESRNASSSYQ